MVRAPYRAHAEDDDFVQPRKMIQDVFDDGARDRLVKNVAGHLSKGVTEPILERAFAYWKNIDETIGQRIEAAVRQGG
jgi:catalase